MRGKYRIIIQNKRIRYDFEIKRNITVIRGDSATGKTVLIEMIREFDENGPDSGIELRCERNCTVVAGRTWEKQLAAVEDSIIFIDEGNSFVSSTAFAAFIQKTSNYYVIVAREGLSALPYSVEEIYGIRNSGRYGSLKQTYNELYHLYGQKDSLLPLRPIMVITEDSNAGFEFFHNVCERRGKKCISIQGKSNVFSAVVNGMDEETLIIADGAAFGSEMEKMQKLLAFNQKLHLYLPESFEWLILRSGVLDEHDLLDILAEPYNYVDSSVDFSWEQYFTRLLVNRTANGYMKYTKRVLNPYYLQEKVENKILRVMENVDL